MSSVRHQILVDASSRALWRAVTTPEGITAWWADSARVDGREGGRVVITHQHEDGAVELRGMVHKWKPTASFQILWDGPPNSPLKGSRVEFQIGRGDGESKVHVVLSGPATEDAELRAALDIEWRDRMLKLRSLLEAAE